MGNAGHATMFREFRERMPPSQLDNYRMLTPQAHPMNDGLSLYPPRWGRFNAATAMTADQASREKKQ
jgi:hypothetical protein